MMKRLFIIFVIALTITAVLFNCSKKADNPVGPNNSNSTQTNSSTSWTTLFQDNFNRTNSVSLGNNWTTNNGNFGILNNEAEGIGMTLYTNAISETYLKISCKFKLSSLTNCSVGLVAKATNNNFYGFGYTGYSNNKALELSVFTNTTGLKTNLFSVNISGINTTTYYELELEINGNSFSGKLLNGSQTLASGSATDSELNGKKYGIAITGNTASFDDFKIETAQ